MSELGSHAYLAFAAGLLSVLSPCVLPLMPAYLSLISGISVEEMHDGARDAVLRRRVMLACLSFVSGFSVVFVLLGVGAVRFGHLVRTWHAEVLGVEFGVDKVDLPEVRRVRVPGDAGAMLDRRAHMRVALHA